jgi:hypothetical protein
VIEQRSAPDRRGSDRFPIEREVKYRAITRTGLDENGAGKTINMSSNGILFETSSTLLPGRRLELSVNWPAQLSNGCPLKLVAKGKVVRSDASTAAVEILQYEFRTLGKAATAPGGPQPGPVA